MDDDWDEQLLRVSIRKNLQQTSKNQLAAVMHNKAKLSGSGRSNNVCKLHDSDEAHVNLEEHLDLEQWPCSQAGKRITVGSDCSGLDSVMTAFHQLRLGKRVKLMFCCDKDEACQHFLVAVHKPAIIYPDITQRVLRDVPHVDFYSAGFPCQPWSSAGLQQGFKDKEGRGMIIEHIQEYIRMHKPKSFLLENVKVLAQKKHNTAFESILEKLRVGGNYHVTWRVLNPLHFGIPQSRPRVFIVGLLLTAVSGDWKQPFRWPKSRVKKPLPLRKFLCGGKGVKFQLPRKGTRAAKRLKDLVAKIKKQQGVSPDTQSYVLDIFGRHPHFLFNKVPCITRTRGGQGGYYLTCQQRLLTVEEMLNLQGLPVKCAAVARECGVTDRQMGQMAGNAIPTNSS